LSRLGNLDSSSIVGERRIGKTSLLKHIAYSETLRKFGYDPDKYLFIFVDLEDYGQHKTPSSFWRDVLEKISKTRPVDLVPVNRKSEQNRLIELRERIIEYFNQDEVHALCSDLDVDYDTLEGTGKASKARELVAYLERRGRIRELMKRLEQLRPHVSWDDTLQVAQEDLPASETRELGALFDSISRQGKAVVLLLDEFESVVRNSNFSLGFFNSLRLLATNHNLALITSSHRELVELCYSKEITGSPFFNIFANIDLGLFTPDEAGELVDKALTGTPVTFDQIERDYLQQMSGRHPFFLQMGGHFLFDAHIQNLKGDERRRFMIRELQRQASQHLLYYWNRLTEDEQSTLRVLVLLNRAHGKAKSDKALKDVVSRSDKVLRELARRGLLCQVEGQYALFSPLFDEWIISEALSPSSRRGRTVEEWLRATKSQTQTDSANQASKKP
jgi:hypothetical protein